MTSRFCKRTPTPHCIQSNLSKHCICKFSSCHYLFLPQLPGESICDISGLIFTVRGKVIFSQASVILFTKRVYPSMHRDRHTLGRHPPPPPSACWDTPAHPVHAGIHAPPPPPPLQRTVYILLECILVCKDFSCN